MILWFAEAFVSAMFVAADIVRLPESPVLKWGFVIVTFAAPPRRRGRSSQLAGDHNRLSPT
jgi:hypothetical protein